MGSSSRGLNVGAWRGSNEFFAFRPQSHDTTTIKHAGLLSFRAFPPSNGNCVASIRPRAYSGPRLPSPGTKCPRKTSLAAKRSSPSWRQRSAGAFTRRASKPRSPTYTMSCSTSSATTGNVDDYYNPANSYLPGVLRTQRGLPITLTLIYKCVGEQLGLTVYGINSPGHFLAAVENGRTIGDGRPPLVRCTSIRSLAAPCLIARISSDQSKRQPAERPRFIAVAPPRRTGSGSAECSIIYRQFRPLRPRTRSVRDEELQELLN